VTRNFGVRICQVLGEQRKSNNYLISHAHDTMVHNIVCFIKSSSVYRRCFVPLIGRIRKTETNLCVVPPQLRHSRTTATTTSRGDSMSRWRLVEVGRGWGMGEGVGECLFLLSRTVLDQPGELDVVEHSGIVTVLLVEHFFNFFFGESFTHCR